MKKTGSDGERLRQATIDSGMGLPSRPEPVPHAPDGFDVGAETAEFLPEAGDLHVDLSKQRLDRTTLDLLLGLARRAGAVAPWTNQSHPH